MAVRIEAFQNRYLAPGQSRIDAILRVSHAGADSIAELRDVRLRMWTPQGARVALIARVHPGIEDLTAAGKQLSAQVRDYPIAAWPPGESLDFQVSLQVPRGTVNDEMLACRPSVVFLARAGDAWTETEIASPEGRIFATWTGDLSLSSRVDERVAHYAARAPTTS